MSGRAECGDGGGLDGVRKVGVIRHKSGGRQHEPHTRPTTQQATLQCTTHLSPKQHGQPAIAAHKHDREDAAPACNGEAQHERASSNGSKSKVMMLKGEEGNENNVKEMDDQMSRGGGGDTYQVEIYSNFTITVSTFIERREGVRTCWSDYL
jgi:hypothetical protein